MLVDYLLLFLFVHLQLLLSPLGLGALDLSTRSLDHLLSRLHLLSWWIIIRIEKIIRIKNYLEDPQIEFAAEEVGQGLQ